MASFKQFNPRLTTSGPGRLAITDTVLTADPAAMNSAAGPPTVQGIMNSTTYVFETPFVDVGATEGGITITKGFNQQGYSVDQSDGEFKTEVVGHSARVETTIAEIGDIEKFTLVWLADDATTVVGTSNERKKGIGGTRVVPHHSLALIEIDEESFLRAFYLRDVALSAGDTPITIAPGSLHATALRLQAFSDPNATAGFEFGYIMEQDGFGGVENP